MDSQSLSKPAVQGMNDAARASGAKMMKRWSSSEIPERDRLAYWVDAVCSTLVPQRCEPRRDKSFFGEIGYDEIGPARLVTLHTIDQRVSRLPNQVGGDPVEYFHVNVMRSGRGLTSQDGREAELAPGGLVLSDSARPYAIDFVDDYSSIVLRIPKPMLQQRIGTGDPFTLMRVDGTSGLGGMVTSMLRDLPAQLPTIPQSSRARLAENIIDLVAAALLSGGGEHAPVSAQLTLTRVKFWIETHLSEKLSSDEIARQCGLSVRHLNRLFVAEGSSLMHHVWERRLARCHRDLNDPALRRRSITDIAFAAGFNDLSHFSRAYRSRFGISPREARPKR
jgi:AraC-like DNA-binding protein